MCLFVTPIVSIRGAVNQYGFSNVCYFLSVCCTAESVTTQPDKVSNFLHINDVQSTTLFAGVHTVGLSYMRNITRRRRTTEKDAVKCKDNIKGGS